MPWYWIAFLLLIVTLLALDLGVLNRRAHAPSMREALGWSALWISVGLLFSGAVFALYHFDLLGDFKGTIDYTGWEATLTYLTGFVLEESLSIDNLFVMVLIFQNYRVPAAYQHRVLFWGILGALVMRACMILGGVWLITTFQWVMYLFGVYLLVQGLLQLKPESEEEESEKRPLLERVIGRVMPVLSDADSGGRFFVRVNGKLHVTQLMVALLSVEVADAVFALDSVPAVLTVSTDSFIVFTSNVFAIMGLRSLYFVIREMMDRFEHLKYALSVILVFVGLKMILHDWLHVPIWISLLIIVGSVVGGVISSLRATRPKPDEQPKSGGTAGHAGHAERHGSAEANGPAKG
jgi:tellurite resistance protein TerC